MPGTPSSLGWPSMPCPVTRGLGWPAVLSGHTRHTTSQAVEPDTARAEVVAGQPGAAPATASDSTDTEGVKAKGSEMSEDQPEPYPSLRDLTTAAASLQPSTHEFNADHDNAATSETAADERTLSAALPPATARAFPDLAPPVETRVVAVANQKGGVGKTTSAVNLAAALALRGSRVLLVDLDPQGNASTALGVDHTVGVPSIYDVLIGGKSLADVVQPAPELPQMFAAPATIDLAGAEIELVSLVARETRLDRAIQAFLKERQPEDRFDYVFIDCPPSLGLLTLNALVAAREVCIPIQCEYYALEGLGQLLRNIEMIQAHLNPSLTVSSILLTMYDGRTRLAAQVSDEVRAHFDAAVLPTAIPRSVRISEAPSHGQTVLTYDPASSGAWCYLQAADEFAVRDPRRALQDRPERSEPNSASAECAAT